MTREIDSAALRKILMGNKRVAIVGLSDNPMRPSYFAGKYLKEHGFDIVPVNPNHQTILGEPCCPDLLSIPGKVDIVDLFQKPDKALPFARQAVEIGAKVLWMQLGVVNEGAAQLARQAGLQVIMDRCMKIEYARLFGGLNLIGVNTGVVSAKRPLFVTR